MTASSAQNKTTTLMRNVTVRFKGVNLVVAIKGGPAWIKVWVDGQVDATIGAGRQDLRERQDADVHGPELDRGPHGQFRGDALHAERHVARARSATTASPRRGCSRRPTPPAEDRPNLSLGVFASILTRCGTTWHRRPRRPLTALVALAERLQAACLERGVSVAVAESCTGGLVAHAITEIAGSSGYFQGGVVSYSNQVKQAQLGVPAAVLAAHGAVSAQTARAMATACGRGSGRTSAASVTGVAGPDGGTDAKPVGLTTSPSPTNAASTSAGSSGPSIAPETSGPSAGRRAGVPARASRGPRRSARMTADGTLSRGRVDSHRGRDRRRPRRRPGAAADPVRERIHVVGIAGAGASAAAILARAAGAVVIGLRSGRSRRRTRRPSRRPGSPSRGRTTAAHVTARPAARTGWP